MPHSDLELAWQRGTVSEISGTRVKVRFGSLQQCRRCLRGEGCGAGVFGRLFARGGAEMWLTADQPFSPGQAVRVGVLPRDLVRSAALLYALPLLAFILAAAAGATFFDQSLTRDLGALVAGLLAAAVSLSLAGRLRVGVLNPRLESLSASAECEKLDSGAS